MIKNSTFLRLDDPLGFEGPAIEIRCAVTALTRTQREQNDAEGWGATRVMYVPLPDVPSPPPAVNGRVIIHDDESDMDVSYVIKAVITRESRTHTLEHVMLFLTPDE
jgi:hypothetical protein